MIILIKVKLLKYDEDVLKQIGMMAGICYGTTNEKAFKRIAKRCLAENHGRVTEFTDIYMEISGISAKVAREFYTHVIGTSRMQESTRYIDYSKGDLAVVKPKSVMANEDASSLWDKTIFTIQQAMKDLKVFDVPVEDLTNLLPLAYETKIVVKINLRALIHMFHVRACTCAYWEYRDLMNVIKKEVSGISEDWKFIADNYFVPKCVASGYCDETTRHCGLRPLKEKE